MAATRHLLRTRAEQLAVKLGAAGATSPVWMFKRKVSYAGGGFGNLYVSLIDRRVTAIVNATRAGARIRTTYCFAGSDNERVCYSLTELAMTIVQADDDDAWEKAAPKGATA